MKRNVDYNRNEVHKIDKMIFTNYENDVVLDWTNNDFWNRRKEITKREMKKVQNDFFDLKE